jgi:hypothetical protein
MALTGTGNALGSAIWNAIKADTGATYTPEQDAEALAKWQIIANEIVAHIVANADVSPTGTTPMNVAAAPVQVSPATGTGAVLAPGTVLGLGKII